MRNWCFRELELTFEGLKNKIKKPVCVREARRDFSQFGLQVVSSWEKVVGMGSEGAEK